MSSLLDLDERVSGATLLFLDWRHGGCSEEGEEQEVPVVHTLFLLSREEKRNQLKHTRKTFNIYTSCQLKVVRGRLQSEKSWTCTVWLNQRQRHPAPGGNAGGSQRLVVKESQEDLFVDKKDSVQWPSQAV